MSISTLKVDAIQHTTQATPNIYLNANGSVTFANTITANSYAIYSSANASLSIGISDSSHWTLKDSSNNFIIHNGNIEALKIDSAGNLTIAADVTIQGNTTTINVDTITIEDKNITLANVASPTNITADGAGLTVLGATNKTLNWANNTSSWTSSENFDLASGKVFKIAGTEVLSGSTLGSGITGSSLTSLGTLTSLGVSGNTTLGDASGDTLTINAGTTTFAQGTANGVLYLNGSKAATSGSGLVFDGTNFATTGGISGTTGTFTGAVFVGSGGKGSAGSAAFIRANNGYSTASTPDYTFWYDDGTGVFHPASAQLGFAIGGSQDMTLTHKGLLVGYTSDSSLSGTGNAIFSGNVGIGTSNLITKFTVQDTERFEVGGGSGFTYNQSVNAARSATVEHRSYGLFLTFGTGTAGSQAERMRLDSSGNLGLGVTPSAWDGNQNVLQIASGAFYGYNNGTIMASNGYYNSGWKYINSGYATYYSQAAGAYFWYTAPSGTAGNPITFTQAMTLTAASNLLVGGTSDPGGSICIYIANRSSVPGTPSGGGVIYVESGALKYKGSSGTITTLGAA